MDANEMIITESQAHKLKLFVWGRLPAEAMAKFPMELINEVNKMIDKAAEIYPQQEEVVDKGYALNG